MNGKELIKKTMRLEQTDRSPWVPFVGVHAANLIGKTATEYLKSTEDIVKGVNKAIELYNPDGIPVSFDLQIEAEILGCDLHWSDDNPPAVISHPLSGGCTLEELKIPTKNDGRIPLFMEATRILREQHPDIALYGLITGPFTLALHLLGTDIFMKMFEDPEYVGKVMRFATDVANFMAKQYIDAGCDVIAIVDPMTSQIDPMSFESFVSPYVTEIFEKIRTAGAFSSFFVCGNAEQNIEVMCLCKPDNISIDENIPLDFVRDQALAHNISFGGNIKLTVVLLMGTVEESMADALMCLDTGGQKGFILAPGCDLAMNTPIENLTAITKLVYDKMLQGELRAAEIKQESVEQLDLKEHWSKNKVVVDIVTLDSSSCAPCFYMVDAVERASKTFGDQVIFKEYRIKEKEGVQMMTTLGVKNIPTIVIDGNIEFSSQIPPLNILEERIKYYLNNKQPKD